MKRPRPHIPLSVQVQVAERQAGKTTREWNLYTAVKWRSQADRLSFLLRRLLPKGAQLDHDPALILREFNEETGKYTPDANDPAYLIYREPGDHLQKTTGRKPGALKTITTKGSDIGLKTKFARLERKGKRRKQRIPSRPFPKQKRSFQ